MPEPLRRNIPEWLFKAADANLPLIVPETRSDGFQDADPARRGEGDRMDFIATWMLSMWFADEFSLPLDVCLSYRKGDTADIVFHAKGRKIACNVKTSNKRYSDRLHLIAKSEELTRNPGIGVYIHVFGDLYPLVPEKPFVEVAGFVVKDGPVWKEHSSLVEIPATNGHKGILIPVTKLEDIRTLPRRLELV